jgi:3-oxoacyl-[acyl-carrier protein] reductase
MIANHDQFAYHLSMQTELRGQTVLITGATGGIGQATVQAFIDEGAHVAAHYHANEAAANALRERHGDSISVHQADLRDEAAVDAMFTDVIGRWGRVDALIANAGVAAKKTGPVVDMPLDRWRDIIDANATSVFLTSRAMLRHLRDVPRESATITIVGSTAAIYGEADQAEYAASKSAITQGLMLSLKNEIVRLAPLGRVNAVCPGWTATPMAEAVMDDPERMGRVYATRSLAAIATPEDIANALVYITSDRLGGHLSGVVLPIAGGMEGRLLRDPKQPACGDEGRHSG